MVTIKQLALGIGLVLVTACTSAKLNKPAPAASHLPGGQPATAELASLPIQPKSGTWLITGKSADDKVAPFTVVLEFRPDGLITVDGKGLTADQAAKEPWNRDFVSRSVFLGREQITVVFHLGGQYTLTLDAPDQMAGVGLVHGRQLAPVKLTWQSAVTTPSPAP